MVKDVEHPADGWYWVRFHADTPWTVVRLIDRYVYAPVVQPRSHGLNVVQWGPRIEPPQETDNELEDGAGRPSVDGQGSPDVHARGAGTDQGAGPDRPLGGYDWEGTELDPLD